MLILCNKHFHVNEINNVVFEGFFAKNVFSYHSISKPPPSLSPPKPQLFSNPPVLLSKLPSFQPLFTPKPLETSQTSLNHDFSHLLRLSVHYTDVQFNKAVHASILKIEEDTYLFNALITSYLKLGHINYAQKVFRALSSPDVVSYTAMISGLAKLNRENEAVRLFFEMICSGIEPNGYTFVALLTACMRSLNLELGFQVHAFLIKTGYLDCTYVVNALMGLYSKCGCFDFVIELFDDMPKRDVVSWNTVISCMVKEGMYDIAFELFHCMLIIDGFRVDHFTLSSLLAACAGCLAMGEGREIHAYAYKIGYENNMSVNNALIEFYSKSGNVKNAVTLFERMPVKDVFTWTEMITSYMRFGLVDLAMDIFDRMPEKNCVSYNALLAGFCQNGEGFRALGLFCKMVKEGIELSDFTLTSVVNACGLIMDCKISEQVHGFVLKSYFDLDDCTKSALLDMCTRCGRMDDAEKIFDQLRRNQSNLINFTSLICGYARFAQPEKAISLVCQWQNVEYNFMDEVALASILGICGALGFQNFGQQIHSYALKYGFLSDIRMGNAIISMYFKCGDLEKAIKCFNVMPAHDTVSWNSLLAGHILHRQGEEALAVWGKMQKAGLQPDTITCVLIISAYRHTNSNLVSHCRAFFLTMKSIYHIEPNSEHYACMVGVLGYWGLLEEAEDIINKMPLEPNASVWRAMLDSCRLHLNATIGKRAAKKILAMEPQDPSTYILKSNLYSASGRWHCSELVREEMRARGFQKIPGRSWIIHHNEVHSFFARDKSHSQSKDVYSALEILFFECSKAGYVPDSSFVLHEVEEHQKKNFLLYHSGKLAATFGLLMTRPGKPVRVMKNILLCGDCHTFLKYVSTVTKREIHVRDASGFHYFSNGKCSCKDYW
ncbi:Pentatricopeptide repeat-containing protein [Forsythia ovata]|uniref:Pentatricopeptide repeat-containing protein n=1 Tax=Forsythia ovata TaxID=205694 RepID=A0ABD1TNY1_9LAMI